MSSKFVKVSSLQGLSSINNGSLIDFIIPSKNYYNLANSYVSLMANVKTTENIVVDPANKVGVHAMVVSGINDIPYRNNVLISDYRFRSESNVIEDVLQSNVISSNLDAYSRDFEQLKSENYKSLCGNFLEPMHTITEQKYGNFRTLSKTSPSTEDQMEVMIPLNSFSPFCNTPLYDGNRFGQSQLKLQIDTSTLELQEYNPYPTQSEWYAGQNIAAGAPHNVLSVTGFNALAPYWNIAVGDIIQVENTIALASSVTPYAVEMLSYAAANNGTITITIDGNLAAGAVTQISIWKVEGLAFPLVNIPQAPAGGTQLTSVVTDALYTEQHINNLKQYIGREIVVSGTTAAFVSYVDRVLVNVEPESPNKTLSRAIITFTAAIPFANAQQMTNGRLTIISPRKLVCADIVNGAGQALTTDTITITGLSLSACKLWCGCKIRVYSSEPDFFTTVQQINVNAANAANLDIVVTDPFTIPANTNMTDIYIVTQSVKPVIDLAQIINFPINALGNGTQTLQLSNPTLVLHELFPSHKQVKAYVQATNKQLQYSYWKVENVNIPTGTNSFVRQFNVDGDCKNIFAIIKRDGNLLSVGDQLKSYRWRINGIDKTTRDIVIDSSLEQDCIIQTFNNSDIASLKSYQSLEKAYGDLIDYIVVPMTSVPFDGQPKQVMLTLNYVTSTLTDKILFFVKESVAVLAL